jgi:anti-sigma regulatory factor (Ser/Thr protein kinase)
MSAATAPLRLELAPIPQSARAARREVVDGLGLQGRTAEVVELLVSEAVTNSVLHAGLGPEERITVSASVEEDLVRVEICDEGGRFAAVSPQAGRREGGYGLKLIAALSRRHGLRHNGTTRVWFEI